MLMIFISVVFNDDGWSYKLVFINSTCLHYLAILKRILTMLTVIGLYRYLFHSKNISFHLSKKKTCFCKKISARLAILSVALLARYVNCNFFSALMRHHLKNPLQSVHWHWSLCSPLLPPSFSSIGKGSTRGVFEEDLASFRWKSREKEKCGVIFLLICHW